MCSERIIIFTIELAFEAFLDFKDHTKKSNKIQKVDHLAWGYILQAHSGRGLNPSQSPPGTPELQYFHPSKVMKKCDKGKSCKPEVRVTTIGGEGARGQLFRRPAIKML